MQQRLIQESQTPGCLEYARIACLIDGGLRPEGVPGFAMEYVKALAITKSYG